MDDLRGTIACCISHRSTVRNVPPTTSGSEARPPLPRCSGVQFVAIVMIPMPTRSTARGRKIVNRTFPTLMDDKCLVADAYSIKSTPEVAVIGPTGTLRYCGPFDDNAAESKVQHHYVADALGNLVASPELASAR